jgi:hypothetical protein
LRVRRSEPATPEPWESIIAFYLRSAFNQNLDTRRRASARAAT